MGIEKLLARLQAESVTPVTPQKSGGVTGKQASIQAVTPKKTIVDEKSEIDKSENSLEKKQAVAGPPLDDITEEQFSREIRALQTSGVVPTFFTKAVVCKRCGPVWEDSWVDDNPECCRWCYCKPGVTIPRPKKRLQ